MRSILPDSLPVNIAMHDDVDVSLPGLTERLRLDKWLWAARFFKTRGLAADEIQKGRVQVNSQVAKASRELRVGDVVSIRQGVIKRTVEVRALSTVRGPAPQAQRLYQETPESVAARQAATEQRQAEAEPASAIEQGRPTKRNRRQLSQWQRWSASIEE
jgi:ribosome-associated heat shock protein Hsp15